MRLTLINQFYVPDLAPTGHMAASLAEHRAGLGDAVTVITTAGGYVSQSPIGSDSEKANPRVIRLWTPRAGKASTLARAADYLAFYFQAFARMCILPGQDVIVSLTTPPFIAWVALVHKLLHRSVRVMLWNMDCYPEIAERTGVLKQGGWISRFLRWLNRRLFGRLDAVVCLDEAMKDLLRSSYDPADGRLAWHVIPNWEPAAQFPRGVRPPDWKGKGVFGLEGQFVVLYLGNAGFGHRFETVMQAAESLEREPVAWVFVGGGSKWPWLKTEIGRRKLNSVILLPYVAKELTPSVMAAADCALITMNEDALGVISPSKLHGSLAMALPILYIGPAGSNVDQAIQRYSVGASLRHDDVDGVVRFIRHLRRNPDDLASFGERARSAFERAYADQVTLPQFDSVIDARPTD
jgi:glycosyltransferase involved in cell wall biosynthesis